MLKAKDIMTPNPITLSPDTEVVAAAKILIERKINGAPVVDAEGRVVGVLCQSDLVAQQTSLPTPSIFSFLDGYIPLISQQTFEDELNKISAATVAQAMTTDPLTVSPEAPLEEVADAMVKRKLYTLPVVDGGRLVGVVGKEDILRTLVAPKK